MKMKSAAIVLSAVFVCVLSSQLRAQAWGAFFKGYVEEVNRQDAAKARQRALDLEQQRLQLWQEQQRMEQQRLQLLQDQQRIEIERIQREQQAAEQKRLAEIAAAEDARRREDLAQVAAYKRGHTGSGFFVSKSGHIITNAHVLGTYQFAIARDSTGKVYELDILAIDKQNDIALLQAEKKTEGLPIMASQAVGKGLRVYAIGYPQPGIQGTESKITDGIISSMTGLRNDNDSYQISVPIQPGNSGGPLLAENGAVVGVVVATVNAAKFLALTGDIPQNVNFAIKTDILEEFLKRNGVVPLRAGKAKANPLGFADQNTVLIAARPERFDLAATPSPSGRVPSTQLLTGMQVTPAPIAPPISFPVALSPGDGKSPAEAANEALVRCQVGAATPVLTLREKCHLVGGREIR